MRKLGGFVFGTLVTGYLFLPLSAGTAAVVTALLRNVTGLHGWWNAWFLFGVFLIVASVTLGASQVAWAALQDTGPIARARDREAERQRAVTAANRESRIAAQAIRSELIRTIRRLGDQLRTRRHWDPEENPLPMSAWRKHAHVLAGEESVSAAYNACRDAYIEIERTDEDNKTMWNNTRRNFYDPTPTEYEATLKIAQAAERELGKLLDP